MAGRSSIHGGTILVGVCVAAVLMMANAFIPAMAVSATPGGYSVRERRFSRAMILLSSQLQETCHQATCSGNCCNGVCVDIFRSAQSCGACNNACAFNRECCSGICVDTHASDRLHCGSCGRVCPDGVPCLFGMCGYSSGRIIVP